jgi:hypothetical protein
MLINKEDNFVIRKLPNRAGYGGHFVNLMRGGIWEKELAITQKIFLI